MDDKGRFIIPGEFRKDGKPFIGDTFEETKVMEDVAEYGEGNRHERRKAAALDAKLRKMADLEAAIADRIAFEKNKVPAK